MPTAQYEHRPGSRTPGPGAAAVTADQSAEAAAPVDLSHRRFEQRHAALHGPLPPDLSATMHQVGSAVGNLVCQMGWVGYPAMISMQHEGLLVLFRNRPELAPELLSGALGLALPKWSEARVESAELTEVVPTEYRADLVVLLLEGKPCFAIIVEVQLSVDGDKRKSWPMYLTSLRSRVNCPAALLVVAPDAAVARWCAQPIELGHPGFTLRPLVMGPQSIPVVVDEAQARQAPELAVLSAMAHGREEVGALLAPAVLAAVEGLEPERFRLYFDLAAGSMNEAGRLALEAVMQKGTYEYQSEFARKYVAQGREEGLLKGREEGREEGLQKGLADGEREALFEVLSARGLEVDEEQRRRIQACTDLMQLKRWLRRAVSAQSAHELFAL